jgi:hypothetical protein
MNPLTEAWQIHNNIGLVDIKVCAVDEIWSGLKLVIPIKDSAKKAIF